MELTISWRFIVGIDISKNKLDCYLLDRKTSQGFELQVINSSEGLQRLGRWLADQQVDDSQTILVSEHTGRYGEHLLRWTTTEEWPPRGRENHGTGQGYPRASPQRRPV